MNIFIRILNRKTTCITARMIMTIILAVTSVGVGGQHRGTNLIRDVNCKKEIGTYDYLITYKYTFALDTVSDNRRYDIMKLEIGKDFSRYYSTSSDKCDSIMYLARKKASGVGVDLYGWLGKDREVLCRDYYLDYPQKGMLTARVGIMQTDYEYEEPLPVFEYCINADSVSNINGYQCFFANAKFRGRTYNVWFSTEIPLSIGPWKFNGAPGLIMKVEDEKKLFKWEAIGISKERGPIHIFDTKGRKDTDMMIRRAGRKQVQAIEEKIWKDPVGLTFEQYGNIVFYIDDSDGRPQKVTMADRDKYRYKYIPPLELE